MRSIVGGSAEPQSADWASSRWTTSVIAATTLVLCILGSWIPSLWADEGATISAATRPLPELWRLIQGIDAVHVAYYLLVHGWLELMGPGAFWLRLPSVVATAAAAFVLHRVVLRLVDPMTALWASGAFMLLPRVTWMAIEGRSSAFSTLVAVLLTYVLLRWSDSGSVCWLIGYSALVALGVALHVYLLLVLPVQGLLLLAQRLGRMRLLAWACAGVGGLAAVLPLVLLSARQTAQVGGGFPLVATVGLRQIAVNQYFLGERPPITGNVGADAWQYAAVSLTAAALAVLCLGLAGAWRRRGLPVYGGLQPLWFGLVWAYLPSVVVLVASLALTKNLFHPRYFAFCAPGLALALGWSLAQMVGRWRKFLAGLVLVALAAPIYVSQRGVNAKAGSDWSQVVSHIDEIAGDSDGIYFSFSNRIISIAYPGTVDRLRDITLVRDPISDASLVGESRSLAEALSPGAPATIWAIYRLDRSDRSPDEAVFRRAGYVPFIEWRGTLNEVVGYR